MPEMSQTKTCSSSLTILVAFLDDLWWDSTAKTHVPLCQCICLHCAGCHFPHHILTPPGHSPGSPRCSPLFPQGGHPCMWGDWLRSQQISLMGTRRSTRCSSSAWLEHARHGWPGARLHRPPLCLLWPKPSTDATTPRAESLFAAPWVPEEIQEPNSLYFYDFPLWYHLQSVEHYLLPCFPVTAR